MVGVFTYQSPVFPYDYERMDLMLEDEYWKVEVYILSLMKVEVYEHD